MTRPPRDDDLLPFFDDDVDRPWLNQTGCLIAVACAGAVALAIAVGVWMAATGFGPR